MPKFRKKPVIVEAVRYLGHNTTEIESFVGHQFYPELESESAYLAGKGGPIFSISIPTLEGNMKAMTGDWIIKGVSNEYYPCKPDIFERTYEPAE